jgi:hypothetical protein
MKDIILFLRIFHLALILPFLLHKRKFPDLCETLASKYVEANYQKDKIIKYTDFLLNWILPVFRNYCLMRSLILYTFLRQSKVNTSINIGVRVDEKGKIRGHSWLTLNGQPYLTDNKIIERFKVIYVFPSDELRKSIINYRNS